MGAQRSIPTLTTFPAGTRFELLRFNIRGIEVTQGIQYYRSQEHLSDPADHAPDNAVTLIARKPAWVRVYVRPGLLADDIPEVTGTMELRRRRPGSLYETVGTLSPQPPGEVTARREPAYSTERETLRWTLNFIVPADLLCGMLQLIARLETPSGAKAKKIVEVAATLQQTLRIAGIMVGYDGPVDSSPGAPAVRLDPPSLADLQTTASWALTTFPVQSAARYRTAGTIVFDRHLQDSPTRPGSCTPNWEALNLALQEQKIADGNRPDVLYYGLLASGIPIGAIVGCNSGGVSSGSVGDQITMAHELGHSCGLPHAPCGPVGAADSSYPAYEPYDPSGSPSASIGEYGLDINSGYIIPPRMIKDFMSYCGPTWISLHNYGRLTNKAILDPVHTCVDLPWWRDAVLRDWRLPPDHWLPDPPPQPEWIKRENAEPLISIIGMIEGAKEIEVKSVMRVKAHRGIPGAKATSLKAELLDIDDRVLASGLVYRVRSHAGCGCDGSADDAPNGRHLFQAFVSDVASGASLRIRGQDGEIGWSRPAPKRKPGVSDLRARVRKDGSLDASWTVTCDEKSGPDIWLQWSADRGRTWNALATGVHGKQVNVSLAGVTAGRVLLRVLASDGFFTVRSKRILIRVPRRPPELSVLSPGVGQILVSGTPMRVWGTATLDTGEPAPAESARWLLDGKEVAVGLDAFVETPAPGAHTLTLLVGDDRRKARTTIGFTAMEVPNGDEQDDDGRGESD